MQALRLRASALVLPACQGAAGEPVLEVQSDKANVEVEASVSGTLARVLAQEGQIVKPGDALAVLAEADEPRDAAAIDRAIAEMAANG